MSTDTHAAAATHDMDFPRSLWAATARPLKSFPALSGEEKADAVVIGGGFTGLRAALDLAVNGVQTTVLEAVRIGYGASGRNGGQVNPILRMTPEVIASKIGPAHAERLVRETIDSADALFADIERFEIGCDPVQKGWLQTAHSQQALDALRGLQEAWADRGARIELLGTVECRHKSGSSAYVGALFHPSAGHIHPLSLVRGFAAAAAARGVSIHEKSPATGISPAGGGKWRVETQSGSVVADTVVIATNGYTDDLWPGLKRTLLPLVSLLAATEPLSDARRASILPGNSTIADTRRMIIYGRYDRDGRLALGCLGSYPEKPDALGGFARIRSMAKAIFPELDTVRWDYKWGGYIAATPDFLPHFHEPAPGLLVGLGFNGRGVAMSSVMGRALASKVLGASDAELPFPAAEMKPMPLHRLLKALLPVGTPLLALADRFDALRA